MHRLLKLSWFSLLVLLCLLAVLFSSWYYTYHRLTSEALIAELTFEPLGDRVYRASLATGDRCTVRSYTLYGEQWRIDSQFIKWKYWASLVGFDPLYRLDRLEGRYRRVEDENRRPRVAYALGDESAVDLVAVSDMLGPLNFLFDASYGSSTYSTMDPDYVYKVYRTNTGLIARVAKRERRPASDPATLTIDIDRACGGEPTFWRAFSQWVNRTLLGFAPAA